MVQVQENKKANALNFLIAENYVVDPKKKSKKLGMIRKRKKRPIYQFNERPVKRIILKFLNVRFKLLRRQNFKVTKNNFFDLIYNHVDAIQLLENKIVFCKMVGKNPIKVSSINFNFLKDKYRKLIKDILKNQTIGFEGIILDKAVVVRLMHICQAGYVRSVDRDRKKLVGVTSFKKDRPAESAKALTH
jgi:hypothetical protein